MPVSLAECAECNEMGEVTKGKNFARQFVKFDVEINKKKTHFETYSRNGTPMKHPLSLKLLLYPSSSEHTTLRKNLSIPPALCSMGSLDWS